jgi:hypothetical protein
MVDPRAVESEVGFAGRLKNPLSIASRAARRPETFPKPAIYCHLLPFSRRKTATLLVTVLFVTPQGHAGQPVIGHWFSVLILYGGRGRPLLNLAGICQCAQSADTSCVQALHCDLRQGRTGAHIPGDSISGRD